MDARRFLLLMAALFLGNAVMGLVLIRAVPERGSQTAVVAAVAMAVGVALVAWRVPILAAEGCPQCGHARDASLAFCARCGASGPSRTRSA